MEEENKPVEEGTVPTEAPMAATDEGTGEESTPE